MPDLTTILSAKTPLTLSGVPTGFQPSLLADLARAAKSRCVFIAPDEAAMRAYMTSGFHSRVMPKLFRWCDEASVVHWTQDSDDAPDWLTADRLARPA